MTDADAGWKWLGDYIISLAGSPDNNDLWWRTQLHAFFNALSNYALGGYTAANYSTAGQPSAWGPSYQAANGGAGTDTETKTEWVEVELPSKITGAPYEIPTPVKDGDEFIGWYDNAKGTGTALIVLQVDYDGTVYAIWKSMGTSTDLENVRPALDTNAPMYDILGRQVDATYRGIVIQNGNKHLLR
jgi:uncharacterized repeat protein (TIGR02543 family)